MSNRYGVIGGSGVYDLPGEGHPLQVETPYGTVEVTHHRVAGNDVFFVPRHGRGHDVPPHRLNPRATVDALARCRVDGVLALNAVGALRDTVPTPSFLVPHDFLDLSGRHTTFFDEGGVHVDMTEPYCPRLRVALAGTRGATPLAREGVYACTAGPRLESATEVRLLQAHADVVGMTGYPEVSLARERGLCYASLCLVTNPGAGLAERVSIADIKQRLAHLRDEALDRLTQAVASAALKGACRCRALGADARM